MIDKIRKGKRVRGLIYYLYGPGKANEHVDPHIVAGWRPPHDIEPPFRADGRRDFRALINLLNAPLDAVNRLGAKDSVWHCVLSAAPDDPLLSDEQWDQVAAEFMDRMGLAPRDDPAGVRWIAVRHGLSKEGIDHIHIVATLARQDGTLPSIHNDYIRARKACQAIEKEFGLRATAAADCTAVPRPSRAETEQAIRAGRSEPPRTMLRRIVADAAATAVSEDDFMGKIRDAGALIRVRNGPSRSCRVNGYAVALPAEAAGTRTTVWFSGGKLAPDLTMPKLRRRWELHPADTGQAASPGVNLQAKSARAFLRSAACSAADQARNEAGFFRLIDDAGIFIRYRYSEADPGEITGYSLALPGHADHNGDLQWHSGSRLSAQLATPRLRQRWGATTPRSRLPVTPSPAERHAIWTDVIQLTGEGAAELRRLAGTNPAAASDAAWATADALRSSARAIGGTPGRQIHRAADDFDRAARETYRAIPAPTPAGNGLRTASRLLAVLRATSRPVLRIDLLIANLVALAEETARLRQAQMRSHQAAAARGAAGQLTILRRDLAPRPQPSPRQIAAAKTTASRPEASPALIAQSDAPAPFRMHPTVQAQTGSQKPSARTPLRAAARCGKPSGLTP